MKTPPGDFRRKKKRKHKQKDALRLHRWLKNRIPTCVLGGWQPEIVARRCFPGIKEQQPFFTVFMSRMKNRSPLQPTFLIFGQLTELGHNALPWTSLGPM